MKALTPSRSASIALSLLFPAIAPTVALAQQQASQPSHEDNWKRLQDVNSRVTACHVVWKRVLRLHAIKGLDPNKEAAIALANAHKAGYSPAKARQSAEAARQHIIERQHEQVMTSTLDFSRVGHTVQCNINYISPTPFGRYTEYSDGMGSLRVYPQAKGKQTDPFVSVSSGPEDALSLSAASYQATRFLLGLPFNETFGTRNPIPALTNATLKVLPDGRTSLEREPRFENRKSQDADALIFAPEGYLTSAEEFGTILSLRDNKFALKKGRSSFRIEGNGYKQYTNGLWFPSKVTITTPNSTTQYFLVEAQFNDEVSPQALHIPPDIRFAAARYGIAYSSNKAVPTYKFPVKGPLPLSDEAVNAWLQKNKPTTGKGSA